MAYDPLPVLTVTADVWSSVCIAVGKQCDAHGVGVSPTLHASDRSDVRRQGKARVMARTLVADDPQIDGSGIDGLLALYDPDPRVAIKLMMDAEIRRSWVAAEREAKRREKTDSASEST